MFFPILISSIFNLTIFAAQNSKFPFFIITESQLIYIEENLSKAFTLFFFFYTYQQPIFRI